MAEFDDGAWRRIDTLDVSGPVAVIGDIHGELSLLSRLVERLDALHPQKEMPLFVVGDVIDRGPDSKGVIELLSRRRARGVRGNHEEWFVRYAHGGGFDSEVLKPFLGGREALTSYGIDTASPRTIEDAWRKVPHEHREWVASLPAALRLTVDGHAFWLVHAGVGASEVTVEEPVARMHELAATSPEAFLWPSLAPEEMAQLDAPMITGHVPRSEPKDAGHVIALDTGCGVDTEGALSAVVLPRRRFVTVRA